MERANLGRLQSVAQSLKIQPPQKQAKPKPADVVVIVGPKLNSPATMQRDAKRYKLRAHFLGTGEAGSSVTQADIADLRARGILGPDTHVILNAHGAIDAVTKKHTLDLGRGSIATSEEVLQEIFANGEHRGLVTVSSCHAAQLSKFSPHYDLGNSTLLILGDTGVSESANDGKTCAAIFKAIAKVRDFKTLSDQKKLDCILTYVRCLTTERTTIVRMKDDNVGGRRLFKAVEGSACSQVEAEQRYRSYRNKLFADYGWKLDKTKYEKRMAERLAYVLTKGGGAEDLATVLPRHGRVWGAKNCPVVLLFSYALFHPDFSDGRRPGSDGADRFVEFFKRFMEKSGLSLATREEGNDQRNFLEFCVQSASLAIVRAALALEADGVEVFNPFERGPSGLSAFDSALVRGNGAASAIVASCSDKVDKSVFREFCRKASSWIELRDFVENWETLTKGGPVDADLLRLGMESAIEGDKINNLTYLISICQKPAELRFRNKETLLHRCVRVLSRSPGGSEHLCDLWDDFLACVHGDVGKIAEEKDIFGSNVYDLIDMLIFDEATRDDLKTLIRTYADDARVTDIASAASETESSENLEATSDAFMQEILQRLRDEPESVDDRTFLGICESGDLAEVEKLLAVEHLKQDGALDRGLLERGIALALDGGRLATCRRLVAEHSRPDEIRFVGGRSVLHAYVETLMIDYADDWELWHPNLCDFLACMNDAGRRLVFKRDDRGENVFFHIDEFVGAYGRRLGDDDVARRAEICVKMKMALSNFVDGKPLAG